MGHAARSASIIKALGERGWQVGVSSYGEGLEYLKRCGIKVWVAPEVGYGVLQEGKVSIKMTIFRNKFLPVRFAQQVAYELPLIEEQDARLVISDTRASTVIAGKLLRKPVLTILNQFNVRIEYPRYRWIIEGLEATSYMLGRIWMRSNRILISDYPPPLTISKQNLVLPKNAEKKTKFIGPAVDKRPEKLPGKRALMEKYGIVEDGRPILLFQASGPIYERRKLVEKMLPILEAMARDYQVIVTLGGMRWSFPASPSLRVYEWVEEPLELMKLADVVVCRAGQTTLAKALSFGKPVVMVPIPAHAEQLGNAESVEEAGAGLTLNEEELDEKTLRRAVETVLDGDFGRNAARYMEAFRSLKPVEAVVEEAEALVS